MPPRVAPTPSPANPNRAVGGSAPAYYLQPPEDPGAKRVEREAGFVRTRSPAPRKALAPLSTTSLQPVKPFSGRSPLVQPSSTSVSLSPQYSPSPASQSDSTRQVQSLELHLRDSPPPRTPGAPAFSSKYSLPPLTSTRCDVPGTPSGAAPPRREVLELSFSSSGTSSPFHSAVEHSLSCSFTEITEHLFDIVRRKLDHVSEQQDRRLNGESFEAEVEDEEFLEAVQRAIEAGANVTAIWKLSNSTSSLLFSPEEEDVEVEMNPRSKTSYASTILHVLVEAGCPKAFELCLETLQGVNFMVVEEERGETVMHTISRCALEEGKRAEIFAAGRGIVEKEILLHAVGMTAANAFVETFFSPLVHRLHRHRPQDMVYWLQKDCIGNDAFTCAGLHGVLHVMWPLVKPLLRMIASVVGERRQVKEFDVDGESEEEEREDFTVIQPPSISGTRFPAPLPLTEVVEQEDWKELQKIGEAVFFRPSHGVAGPPTTALFRLLAYQLRLPRLHRQPDRSWNESSRHSLHSSRAASPHTSAQLEEESDRDDETLAEGVRRCVQAGACVSYRIGSMGTSPLHDFIASRYVKCVGVCMSAASRIDFTVKDMITEQTPLHYLMKVSSSEALVSMLRLIVMRQLLAEDTKKLNGKTSTPAPNEEVDPCVQSGDEVDWSQQDANGFDALTTAAYYQVLHLVWPTVRILPIFSTLRPLHHPYTRPRRRSASRSPSPPAPHAGSMRVPISTVISQSDWSMLGEDQQSYLCPLYGVAADATVNLIALSRERVPNLSAIRRCVRNGAQVTFTGSAHSARQRFSHRRAREPVVQWSGPEAFREDPAQHRLLWGHSRRGRNAEEMEIVMSPLHQFIVKDWTEAVRICMSSSHPIDFTVTDETREFKELPEELSRSPPPRSPVGSPLLTDWKTSDERRTSPVPEPSAVGQTPLHYICMANSPETAGQMMEAVVERLQWGSGVTPASCKGKEMQRHKFEEDDKIDWGQEDECGNDFLSTAAAHHLLHVLWPLVKPLPPFCAIVEAIHREMSRSVAEEGEEAAHPIMLSQPILDEDWQKLGKADQMYFSRRVRKRFTEESAA